MAIQSVTAEVKKLIAAGYTTDDIEAATGTRIHHDFYDTGRDIWQTNGLQWASKIAAMAATATPAAPVAVSAPSAPAARPGRRTCTSAHHDHDNRGICYDCGGYSASDDAGRHIW